MALKIVNIPLNLSDWCNKCLVFLSKISQIHAPTKPFRALNLTKRRWSFNLTSWGLFPCSLRSKYGRLFSLKLGSYKLVVAGSSGAVREVLVTRSAKFGGRPKTHAFEVLSQGKLCPLLFLAKRSLRLKVGHNFIMSRAQTGTGVFLACLVVTWWRHCPC